MAQNTYHVIGVMSGTSLDGVDLAYVEFQKDRIWKYKIIKAQTLPYPKKWATRLKEAFQYPEEKLMELDVEYTRLLVQTILGFIEKNGISKLDAVCSHGHTVLHQPACRQGRPKKGITMQIGNLSLVSKLLGKTVVCDFRKQDVELGGQGAPLVPIGDKLLFPEYDYCVNLGGFANVSTEKNHKRIAWDICPVNTILNFYAQKLGKDYDKNGELSAAGKIDEKLLEKLNRLEFYKKPAPKSLGIEWVNEKIFPLLEKSKLSPQSILATFTAHVAEQIGNSLEDNPNKKCLFTGGGTYNAFLMESVQKKTQAKIIIPEKGLIEYKEALIFGLLGVLKLRGETNVLSSVTGAKKDHSSGVVWEV